MNEKFSSLFDENLSFSLWDWPQLNKTKGNRRTKRVNCARENEKDKAWISGALLLMKISRHLKPSRFHEIRPDAMKNEETTPLHAQNDPFDRKLLSNNEHSFCSDWTTRKPY